LPFGQEQKPSRNHELPQFYFVRHLRARRYIVRVDADGRVRVTIPRGGSKKQADAFARTQLHWIEQQRARVTPTTLTPDQRHEFRARAAIELPARVSVLAREHAFVGSTDGLPLRVSRISVRSQRTRWGSCGRDGLICLNWRLILMPEFVRDYVIVHELMHLRRLDHSRAFWRLVETACPDYRRARLWLRQHGASLR
jgi:predicted metal-dependent hydrolase